jgi:hypothetical protein
MAGVPAIITNYRTYQERYSDLINDTFNQDYAGVMGEFTLRGNPESKVRTASANKRILDTIDVMPHHYLLLTGDPGDHIVTVIHRPSIFRVPMGAHSRIPDATVTAFIGDVIHGLTPTTVYWPDDAMQPTAVANIPTSVTLDAAFAGDPAIGMVGPFATGDAGTEAKATRKLAYLPPRYVPMAIGMTLTPRQAWERIGGAIRTGEHADTEVVACAPLLDWLKSSCTVHEDGDANTKSEAPSYPYPPEGDLIKHRADLIKLDLPGLFPSQEGAMPGTREVVGALNNLTEEQRLSRQEANQRTQQASEKTPTTYYGSATVVLNRYTHTSTVAALPPIYMVVAATTKKTERLVLQEEINAIARDLGLSACTPILTPGLAKKITQANFTHEDMDNLGEGIQPFVTCYRTLNDKSTVESRIQAYDTLVQGAGAQLTDIYSLKDADKVFLPLTILQVTYTLKSFRVLLHALLGHEHTFVVAYGEFIRNWDQRMMHMEQRCTTPDIPAKMVRWVQIKVSRWFTRQYNSPAPIDAPNFVELIDAIEEMRTWEPPIPLRYMAITPQPRRTPGTPSGSNPSGIRTPAPAPAPYTSANPTEGRRERITNTTYKAPHFEQFKELGLSMRTVRDAAREAGKPVPTNTAGTECCLSYHVLGFCWENCGRKEDHRAHTAPEDQKLKEWCTSCYREGGPM